MNGDGSVEVPKSDNDSNDLGTNWVGGGFPTTTTTTSRCLLLTNLGFVGRTPKCSSSALVLGLRPIELKEKTTRGFNIIVNDCHPKFDSSPNWDGCCFDAKLNSLIFFGCVHGGGDSNKNEGASFY
ncbi:unnamed protein product [Linum trigynum]|uniref:Uncharacterized protein n=1 Tax=Linum trigynum TaxID=586398 RepID=A0AAV2CMQ8_9ROSI